MSYHIRNKTSLLTGNLDNNDIVQASLSATDAYQTLRFTFKTLPTDPARRSSDMCWRILLNPVHCVTDIKPYELCGDVTVGLQMPGGPSVDIDLNDWDGAEFGISRQHVCLRPTANKLFVIDLNSTNGTHVNGLPIGPSWAHSLNTGDVLTLGLLNLRIAIFAPCQNGLISTLES